jgi:hypothetical protein
MQDLGYARSTPRGFTLHEDVAWREANRANNERQQAQKQRRRLRIATRMATRARGEETLFKPESSGDDDDEEDKDEEEGEITPSTHSLPHEDPLAW